MKTRNQDNLLVFSLCGSKDLKKLNVDGEKSMSNLVVTCLDSDEYYYRILGKMTKLRTAHISNSRDISNAEAEMGESSCEELLGYILDQRESIYGLLEHFVEIGAIYDQWADVYDQTEPTLSVRKTIFITPLYETRLAGRCDLGIEAISPTFREATR